MQPGLLVMFKFNQRDVPPLNWVCSMLIISLFVSTLFLLVLLFVDLSTSSADWCKLTRSNELFHFKGVEESNSSCFQVLKDALKISRVQTLKAVKKRKALKDRGVCSFCDYHPSDGLW